MKQKKLNSIIRDLRLESWIQALLNSSEIFIVGGPVRDSIIGKEIKDIDLLVDGITPDDILRILKPFGKAGIKGESFAVIKFTPHDHTGEAFDIAVPRIDRKIGEGHKGFEVNIDNVTVEEDLKRRDFTVNAIAINIKTMEILDPFNGVQDINYRLLKAVDPSAFSDDALRILRGIRFAARLGFTIESQTMKMMRENSHRIKHISKERIFDEFQNILLNDGNTQIAFDLISETELDLVLFGKKLTNFSSGLENLDVTSFYHTLAFLGDVNPGNFVKKQLKGPTHIADNVRNLDRIFSLLPNIENDEDLKFMLSKVFTKTPDIMDAVILPEEVDDIVLQIRLGKIPLNMSDVAVSGEDIMSILGLKEGPEVGMVKEAILRDALMNRFNWKDREDSINRVQKFIK